MGLLSEVGTESIGHQGLEGLWVAPVHYMLDREYVVDDNILILHGLIHPNS